MSDILIDEIMSCAESGTPVSAQLALGILTAPASAVPGILHASSKMTQREFGGKVILCSIMNAKSGACTEDCAFCAQSGCHDTDVDIYPLKNSSAILEAFDDAGKLPISNFGIVTSGADLTEEEFEAVRAAVESREGSSHSWCGSLGALTVDQLKALKDAGMVRFHHNLETSRSFFPEVCTTHSYDERIKTIRDAKSVGMEVCCGGIFGMGEAPEQRVEFALTLAEESIDSIPMNFLMPIEGTRFSSIDPMKPLDILRTVAMMRMTNPRAEIKVCAGRLHLRDLQSMIFFAGATGMMIGDLLTVAGRDVETDLKMLDDLEVDYAWRDVD